MHYWNASFFIALVLHNQHAYKLLLRYALLLRPHWMRTPHEHFSNTFDRRTDGLTPASASAAAEYRNRSDLGVQPGYAAE